MLGLEAGESIPEIAFLETFFTVLLTVVRPVYLETAISNYMSIVRGGLTTEYLYLTCYATYTVQEYILGAGPNTLTVAYDRMAEAQSYELYRREHDAGQFRAEPLMNEGEYEATLLESMQSGERDLAAMVGDRESVVFLAPMGAHSAIAVEAWQAVAQWDLQTDDDDVVYAVRYGEVYEGPEHTQTLANLRSRITTAVASDAFAWQRIANVSGLTQYYRDIGAYGDITPGDGSTDTFTPAQPPPALTCASGTVVTTPDTNRGLVHDCSNLLAAKDTLQGTAALNWSKDLANASWEGITTSGTPNRVTELGLSSESLNGTIPAELGRLFELTHLDLSSNLLTGSVPHELGWLYNLEELRLSGNSLTGCIPVALEDVATNDLGSLNLLYCAPPAPGSLSAGTVTQTSVPLTWGTVSNTSKYRVEYRLGRSGDWTTDDDTLTTTSHTVDELECGSAYQFRVSAFGSGMTYAAAWSEPSAVLAASSGECANPEFAEESYSFSVPGDAATGDAVGTVLADDPQGDAVTYSITAGNTGDAFAIGSNTGQITVACQSTGRLNPAETLHAPPLTPYGETLPLYGGNPTLAFGTHA